MLMRHYEAF